MEAIEQPITTETGRDGTETTHPAFAQISANRITGTNNLYGSDFTHHATIRVRVHKSKLRRDLSHDWHFAGEQYIEVELSESQWATFVSAMNVGDGVPCTLRRLQGEDIPELPPPDDRSKQFAGEIDEHCQDSIASLRKLIEKIDEMKLPKGKSNELKSVLGMAVQQLECNLPFIAKSFGEHTEKTVEKAKQEIHGYMMGVITRSGLEALGAKPPLLIEDRTEKQNEEET